MAPPKLKPRGPQATLKSETVIGLLRSAPNPLTTREIAARLPGTVVEQIASRLSRMATWGQIARERVTIKRDGGLITTRCLWSSIEPNSSFAASALDRPRSRSRLHQSPSIQLGTSQAAGAGCDPNSAVGKIARRKLVRPGPTPTSPAGPSSAIMRGCSIAKPDRTLWRHR